MTEHTPAFVHDVGFDLIGDALGRDLRTALHLGAESGVIGLGGKDPLDLFRAGLARSIRDIEMHPRGRLLRAFLLKGPYEEAEGEVPPELRDKRLSDDETRDAVAFVFSWVVSSFQGFLAETLAIAPVVRLVEQLRVARTIPNDARLAVGRSVLLATDGARREAADMHVLAEDHRTDRVHVYAVVEVKSYRRSKRKVRDQLAKHATRLGQGITVEGRSYARRAISTGAAGVRGPIFIEVRPETWRLPRTFHFEPSGDGRRLVMDGDSAIPSEDQLVHVDGKLWRVTLRWSREALAEAAFHVSFWFMEELGKVIYAAGVPRHWSEMTAAEAGRNAAKAMLFYAIQRARNLKEWEPATALYNTYGFGYALGMNFVDADGRRLMLWPEDLDEIAARGQTRNHGRIRGWRHARA